MAGVDAWVARSGTVGDQGCGRGRRCGAGGETMEWRLCSTQHPVAATPQMVYHLLRFDGAARPNPGHGGAGVVIYKVYPDPNIFDEDIEEEVFRGSFFLGFNITNNEAEWMALVKGLEAAVWMGVGVLDVEGDSELVINQMTGDYQTRNSRLQYWKDRAEQEADKLNLRYVQHIHRRDNTLADWFSQRSSYLLMYLFHSLCRWWWWLKLGRYSSRKKEGRM